jgi:hypothetical protein
MAQANLELGLLDDPGEVTVQRIAQDGRVSTGTEN